MNPLRPNPGLLPLLLTGITVAVLIYGGAAIQTSTFGIRSFEETKVEGHGFPKRLMDPSGITQTLAAPPRRIVSAVLAADEMLTALVTPDRLAGVTALSTNPGVSNCASLIPAHAGKIAASIETILALEPDCVFTAGYIKPETVRLLVSAGVPVVRFGNAISYEGIFKNILATGAVVGNEPGAERLVADMKAHMAEIGRRIEGLARPRVLYFTDGYTAGDQTITDEVIERAGGFNVAKEAGFHGPQQVSVELANALQPEVIVVPSWSVPPDQGMAEKIFKDPLWQEVPAVRNRRVYAVRAALIDAVSQYAVDGLEDLARLLHPEAFPS